jgi:alpha-2-macroglobulin
MVNRWASLPHLALVRRLKQTLQFVNIPVKGSTGSKSSVRKIRFSRRLNQGRSSVAANRNVILAAAVALVTGLWGGLVLAQVGGSAGPAALFGGSAGEGVRAANAPRMGLIRSDQMAFERLRIDAGSAQPRACLEFSQPVATDEKVNLADFIALEPAAKFSVEANGNLLCLAGLDYETDRKITIRAGLPSTTGSQTALDETANLSFGDRPTFIGFAGSGVILPRAEADGIGIETVNVSKMKVEVIRVGDRALARETVSPGEAIGEGSWDWWNFEDAASQSGQSVFKGELDVPAVDGKTKLSNRNQTITTVFALGATLKTMKPGAYVVKLTDASPSAGARGQNNDRPAAAYRWVIYTDLALQSFEGATGLDVVVRSLKSARPEAGVTLTLIAQNGEELARVRTDGEGRGRIADAAMRGDGAMRPRYVMAYAGDGDFAVLDLERPALDLSQNDVGGRATPRDIDAYMFTERGIYRPGETVRLTALVRDPTGKAISNRQSTLVVYRPNGTEAVRQRLERAAEAGAVIKNVPIDRSAPRGQWRAALEVDGQPGEAGSVAFAVEDFVPQRMKVEVKASEAPIGRGESRAVDVAARFLYGAPGAGLPITGEARIAVDPNPFPAKEFAGFQFGRTEESFNEKFYELDGALTDGDGRGQLQFALRDIGETSLPLRARVVAAVAEPGGRTVREGFQIPIRLSNRYIGLKPRFQTGRVASGATVAFDVIAVDPRGQRAAANGVKWQLVEEDWSYDWYLDGGQWRWRRTGRDIVVAAGSVDVAAAGVGEIARDNLRDGSYRLVVADETAGAVTSTRFGVGWVWDAGDEAAPDTVAVVPPVEAVKVGGRVRVQIKPPYPGEAQIVVATDRVQSMKTMRIGPEGATFDLRADPAWGAGVYVLVTVMTPRDPAKAPAPRRAVGVAYVPFDMSARTLKVDLPQNQTYRPRTRQDIEVAIANAKPGERVRMTLAAVDEGILQLTKFDSPDPTKFYFGRKALGVALKDDYGRVLNPNLGAPAVARQGGDGLGGEGLTVVPTKTVALWSGLVTVQGGKAKIPLDLPDFNGQLRLMAVAWTEQSLGADAEAATVRDPVVAELTLPRFLAPGDGADATLELSNVEGPAGAYRVSVNGAGAAQMPAFAQSFQLAAGGQTRARIPLSGAIAGLGEVQLTLEGPDGLKISRAYPIQSRTPFMPITLVDTQSQAAGATWSAPRDALAAFAQGEGKALISYSALRGVDAAPLLDVLDRYPFGCSEQLTSRALPLLYANALAESARKPTDPKLRQSVQDTVNRLLDRQGADGAFGLWRAEDRAASPWLGAYVTEFLQRAKAAGYVVPDAPMANAYKALRTVARLDDFGSVSYDTTVYRWAGGNDSEELLKSRAAAYALYVLAKGGKADIGQVRYFNDAKLRNEPSPLARAQIGAALAYLGDRARARSALRSAEQALGYRNNGDWYQTPLRDLAGVIALAAEAGDNETVDRLSGRLEREGRDAASLMTQEQARLVVAADALIARAGKVNVTLAGQPVVGATSADQARINAGLSFLNAGQGPVFRTLTTSGVPRSAPPAAANGLTIVKRLFRMSGQSAEGQTLRQGDRVIVVLSGNSQSERLTPAVLVDLLPAGLEIEQVLTPEDGAASGPEQSAGAFAWLGALTYGRVTEARDDRFVAAADLQGQQGYVFAYVARAVTPGAYTLPGAQVEDMYRPGVFGRTAAGRLTIAPQ